MLQKITLIMFVSGIFFLNDHVRASSKKDDGYVLVVKEYVGNVKSYEEYSKYLEKRDKHDLLVLQIKASYGLVRRCNQHCNPRCYNQECDPVKGCHDFEHNGSYSEDQKKERYYNIIEKLRMVRDLKEMPTRTGFSNEMTVPNSFQLRMYLDRLQDDTGLDDLTYFKNLFHKISTDGK